MCVCVSWLNFVSCWCWVCACLPLATFSDPLPSRISVSVTFRRNVLSMFLAHFVWKSFSPLLHAHFSLLFFKKFNHFPPREFSLRGYILWSDCIWCLKLLLRRLWAVPNVTWLTGSRSGKGWLFALLQSRRLVLEHPAWWQVPCSWFWHFSNGTVEWKALCVGTYAFPLP